MALSKSGEAQALLDQMGSVLEAECKPFSYLVDGFIIEGAYHLLSGAQGTMKSFVGLWLAKVISETGRLVVYVDKENPTQLVKQRFESLEIRDESNLKYWGFHSKDEPPRLLTIGAEYLALAEQFKPVLIFDSLIRFHDLDENQAKDMKQVSEKFQAMVKKGATVIVIHHCGKPMEGRQRSSRGSSEIGAGCDIGFEIASKTNGRFPVLTLKCFKNRFGPEEEFRLAFTGSGFERLGSEEKEERVQRVLAVKQAIRDKPGIDHDGISKALRVQLVPIGKNALYDLLSEEDGHSWEVRKVGQAGKHTYHLLDASRESASHSLIESVGSVENE